MKIQNDTTKNTTPSAIQRTENIFSPIVDLIRKKFSYFQADPYRMGLENTRVFTKFYDLVFQRAIERIFVTNCAPSSASQSGETGNEGLRYASPTQKDNYYVVWEAVRNDRSEFRYASDRMQQNPYLIRYVIITSDCTMDDIIGDFSKEETRTTLGERVRRITTETNLMLRLVKNGCPLIIASSALRDDPDLVKAAVTRKGDNYLDAGDRCRRDPEIIKIAIKNGCSLQAIPKDLVTPELIETALLRDGNNIDYTDESTKNNPLLALMAVKNGASLRQVGNKLRQDPIFVREALRSKGRNVYLKDALPMPEQTNDAWLLSLLTDPKHPIRLSRLNDYACKNIILALAAINVNITNWEDAQIPPEEHLKLAKEILPLNGLFLRCAPEVVRKDKECVILAITSKHPGWVAGEMANIAFDYAAKEWKKDRTMALLAIKHFSHAYESVHPDLKNDPSFRKEAREVNPKVVEYF